MPTQQNGLLDRLGIGAIDEGLIRRQQINAGASSNRAAARQRALGQQAAPLLQGLFGAVGDAIGNRNDARSFRGFFGAIADNANVSRTAMEASAAGLTVEQLNARRAARQAVIEADAPETIDDRVSLARRIAEIASSNGDMQLLANSLQEVSRLNQERTEQERAGLILNEDRETAGLGRTVRLTSEPIGTVGSAVRIESGPDAGKYMYTSPNGEPRVVNGYELIPTAERAPQRPTGGRTANSFSVPKQVRDQVGASGVAQARNSLKDMQQQGQIVSNIAELFLSAQDPQALLSTAGRLSVTSDKVSSAVESTVDLLTVGDRSTTDITWNGKRVPARVQLERFKESALDGGLAEYFDVDDISQILPENIRANSAAAELYLANIINLAYLDARLNEPSNRGLSDRDIQNALERIGANTANPLVFANHQLKIIEDKLLPRIDNLGNELTIDPDDSLHSREDLVNWLYNPAQTTTVRDQLLSTAEELQQVINEGRRGQNRLPEGVTQEMIDQFDSLSPAEQEAFINGL